MIPATFDYIRADCLTHALELLASACSEGSAADADSAGGETRLLAGGQSLLPLMKLRLAAPNRLVDIGDLRELRYIQREGDTIAIGAGTRYADLLRSDVIRQAVPLLGAAAAGVGDAQIRYRGTIGGALAHADPLADIPCAALALDAEVVVLSVCGRRVIPVASLVTDHFTTALDPDEAVTEIRIPAAGGERFCYRRFTAGTHGWAAVAVAVAGTRIALAGMGAAALRAEAAEDVLATGGDFAAAAELAAAGTSPVSDRHADAEYRRHLARVLTLRALTEAHRR